MGTAVQLKILERVVLIGPSSSDSMLTWVARLSTYNRNERNLQWKFTSVAVIPCVVHQLATQGVEKLGKMIV